MSPRRPKARRRPPAPEILERVTQSGFGDGRDYEIRLRFPGAYERRHRGRPQRPMDPARLAKLLGQYARAWLGWLCAQRRAARPAA